MLEPGFATEQLPVGILDPPSHNLFIRERKDVLQIQQTSHQARRNRRTATPRWEKTHPFVLEH